MLTKLLGKEKGRSVNSDALIFKHKFRCKAVKSCVWNR